MTFDLYAFPAPGPESVPDVRQLLETEVEDLRFDSEAGSWLPPPGPQVAKFLDELNRRWPFRDDDPDGSPWSSWPLWQPVAGGGTALNIRWSLAASIMSPIMEIADRSKMIIYDPQADQLINPRTGMQLAQVTSDQSRIQAVAQVDCSSGFSGVRTCNAVAGRDLRICVWNPRPPCH